MCSATSPAAAAVSVSSTCTSWSVQWRVRVSTTQNDPSTSPVGATSGKPAHAATPRVSIVGLSCVRGSRAASSTISLSPVPTTYWQNDSATVRLRMTMPVPSSPTALFQNERRSSTIVTNA